MKLFIGIDPGLSGAVAVVSEAGRVVSLQDVPTEEVKRGKKRRRVYIEARMATLLSAFALEKDEVAMIALENVHAMPGQGVSSMFSFGVGFGLWRGIVATLKLPLTLVEPAAWKPVVGIARGAEKGDSIIRACQLFPNAADQLTRKKDDGRADALLLAEFARRQFRSPRKA